VSDGSIEERKEQKRGIDRKDVRERGMVEDIENEERRNSVS
jgi:hypothetical protein